MTDKAILLEKAKNARLKRYISNCYDIGTLEKAETCWSIDDNFIFAYEDHGVKRLIFFSKDWSALDELVRCVDSGTYYLEYMCKSTDEHAINGGMPVARMMRLSNSNCNSVLADDSEVMKYKDSTFVEFATEEDAEEIEALLWQTFRTEISHLLYSDELAEIIKKGQITVHRTDGHIDALLQADIMPKKFYINQIINLGDKCNSHALLINRLDDYVNGGGRYLYAWVEETNVASIKFHGKYGMKHDGMMSIIYRVGKEECR